LDNAQRILKDAVNQQLNEMDINEGELWANTADDIQKMLESYYLDEYLMDEPVLNEDAPSDLFGGLFDGPEKGVKGIITLFFFFFFLEKECHIQKFKKYILTNIPMKLQVSPMASLVDSPVNLLRIPVL
jgi:hypothetical protein